MPAVQYFNDRVSMSIVDLLQSSNYENQKHQQVAVSNRSIPKVFLGNDNEQRYVSRKETKCSEQDSHSFSGKFLDREEKKTPNGVTVTDVDLECHSTSKVNDGDLMSSVKCDNGKIMMESTGSFLNSPPSPHVLTTPDDCHDRYVRDDHSSSKRLHSLNPAEHSSNSELNLNKAWLFSQSGDIFNWDLTSNDELTSHDHACTFSENSQGRFQSHTDIADGISFENDHFKLAFKFDATLNCKLSNRNDCKQSISLPALNSRKGNETNFIDHRLASKSVRVLHTSSPSYCDNYLLSDIRADSQPTLCSSCSFDSPSMVTLVSTSAAVSKYNDGNDSRTIVFPMETSVQPIALTTTSGDGDNINVESSFCERSDLDSPCSSTESGYYGYQQTPFLLPHDIITQSREDIDGRCHSVTELETESFTDMLTSNKKS